MAVERSDGAIVAVFSHFGANSAMAFRNASRFHASLSSRASAPFLLLRLLRVFFFSFRPVLGSNHRGEDGRGECFRGVRRPRRVERLPRAPSRALELVVFAKHRGAFILGESLEFQSRRRRLRRLLRRRRTRLRHLQRLRRRLRLSLRLFHILLRLFLIRRVFLLEVFAFFPPDDESTHASFQPRADEGLPRVGVPRRPRLRKRRVEREHP